jgi:hypothetical protein
MAIYKNISSIATTTLITKGGNTGGNINKITISNHDNSDLVIIKLYLDDGDGTDANNPYTLVETTIPPLVTLVLEDGIKFNSSIYNLRATTSTTANVTIILNR